MKGLVWIGSLCVLGLLSFSALRDARVAFEERGSVDLGAPIESELTSARYHRDQAFALIDQARETGELEEQKALLCRALSAYGAAIKRTPHSKKLLSRWAKLKHVLSDVSCLEPHTSADYQDVFRVATEYAPKESLVWYRYGEVLLKEGEFEKGYHALRQFILFGRGPSALQQKTVLSYVNSESSLQKIFPAKLPYILNWSRRLKSYNPSVFRQLAKPLQTLVVTALKDRSPEIPLELRARELFRLLEVFSDTPLRQVLDTKLSEIYASRNDMKRTEFFSERAKFASLPIVRSYLRSDSRPEKNSFSSWGVQHFLYFDRNNTSAGFFIPAGKRVALLELRGLAAKTEYQAEQLEVYVSNNNYDWHEIAFKEEPEALDINKERYLTIAIDPGNDFRYWKIHYASASQNGSFGERLPRLVQAYGREE